jgi:hypothetical protein
MIASLAHQVTRITGEEAAANRRQVTQFVGQSGTDGQFYLTPFSSGPTTYVFVTRPSAMRTPVGGEMLENNATEHAAITEPESETKDQISEARDRRIELLVRKFDKTSTTEDDARLHILTQRLRRLVPRVTERETDRLASTIALVEEFTADLDATKKKYGLR